MPITKDAVALRLHPDRWPADFQPSVTNGALPLHRNLEAARGLFESFELLLASVRTDTTLTAEGRSKKLNEFRIQHDASSDDRLASIRKDRQKFEEVRARLVDENTAQLPTEPYDIALMQEIRAWLRSLTPGDRSAAIRRAADGGDRQALRAALTAPTYLTGINEDEVAVVREVLFEQDHPDTTQTHRFYGEVSRLAEIAIAGLSEYMADMVSVEARTPTPEPGYPRKQRLSDPEGIVWRDSPLPPDRRPAA